MNNIEERLHDLELKGRDKAKDESNTKVDHNEQENIQWRPKHVILGGWPPMIAKAQIEKEAREWL